MSEVVEREQNDALELPELTPMQQAFVEAWYRASIGELRDDEGERITSDVDIRAYAGYATENMSRAAQYVEAWKLRRNPKIAKWLHYLTEHHRECTLDSHLERLNRLGIKAEKTGDITNARLCEVARADAAGIRISRHEVTSFDARTKDDVQKYLEDQLGLAIETKRDKSGTYVPVEPSEDSVEPDSAD